MVVARILAGEVLGVGSSRDKQDSSLVAVMIILGGFSRKPSSIKASQNLVSPSHEPGLPS